jgi:hypothetical protein
VTFGDLFYRQLGLLWLVSVASYLPCCQFSYPFATDYEVREDVGRCTGQAFRQRKRLPRTVQQILFRPKCDPDPSGTANGKGNWRSACRVSWLCGTACCGRTCQIPLLCLKEAGILNDCRKLFNSNCLADDMQYEHNPSIHSQASEDDIFGMLSQAAPTAQ